MKVKLLIWILVVILLAIPVLSATQNDIYDSTVIHADFETNLTFDTKLGKEANTNSGGVNLETSDCQVGTNCGNFGANHNFNFGNIQQYQTLNWTVSVWVRDPATNTFKTIIARFEGGADDGEWRLPNDDRAGQNEYFLNLFGSTPAKVSIDNGEFNNDEWFHICASTSVVGSTANISLRFNGTDISYDAFTDQSATGIVLVPTNITLASQSGTNPGTGRLDEFLYINRTLSGSECTYLYDLGTNGTTMSAEPVDDTTPPVISSTAISNSTPVQGQIIQINLTVSDDVGLAACDLAHNATTNSSFVNFTTITFPDNPTSSVAIFNITSILGVISDIGTCNDTSGNSVQSASIDYTATVGDIEAPVIIGFALNDTVLKINEDVFVECNATDNEVVDTMAISNNLSGVFSNFTTSSPAVNESTLSATVTNNLIKNNVVGFQCTAVSGFNTTQSSIITYTVENTPPNQAIIITPANNTLVASQPQPFQVTFPVDADGDTLNILWYIRGNGSDDFILNQTTPINTTFNASDGTYNLTVSLDDGDNFSTNVTHYFTLDTVEPIIVCPVLINGTKITETTTFTCTIENTNLEGGNFTVRDGLGGNDVILSSQEFTNIQSTSQELNITISSDDGDGFRLVTISGSDDHNAPDNMEKAKKRLKGLKFENPNDVSFIRQRFYRDTDGKSINIWMAYKPAGENIKRVPKSLAQSLGFTRHAYLTPEGYAHGFVGRIPNVNIPFGFVFKDRPDLILRDQATANFKWGREHYMDFDAIVNGTPIMPTLVKRGIWWGVRYDLAAAGFKNNDVINFTTTTIGGVNQVFQNFTVEMDANAPSLTVQNRSEIIEVDTENQFNGTCVETNGNVSSITSIFFATNLSGIFQNVTSRNYTSFTQNETFIVNQTPTILGPFSWQFTCTDTGNNSVQNFGLVNGTTGLQQELFDSTLVLWHPSVNHTTNNASLDQSIGINESRGQFITTNFKVPDASGFFDETVVNTGPDVVVWNNTAIYNTAINRSITLWSNYTIGTTSTIMIVAGQSIDDSVAQFRIDFDNRGPDNVRCIYFDGTSSVLTTTPLSFMTGDWNLIGCNLNLSNGIAHIILYVNDTLVDQNSFSSPAVGKDLGFVIGDAYDTFPTVGPVNVLEEAGLDEVTFYNKTLKQADMTFIYDLGEAGTKLQAESPSQIVVFSTYTSVDTTPPVIDNLTFSSTLVRQMDTINLTIGSSDNFLLSFLNVSVNETGVQVNFTGTNISGTSGLTLVQRQMNTIGVFQFQVTVIDSEGNNVQNLTETIRVDNGELPNVTFINLTSEGGEGQVILDRALDINNTLNNLSRTNDTTPTFSARTEFNANCALVDNDANINYTDIILGNSLSNCSTTGGQSHVCTLPDDNRTGIGVFGFSIGCQNTFGDQFSEASRFFQVNITDPVPPSIIQVSPDNNAFFAFGVNNTFNLTVDVTDNHFEDFNVEIFLDGSLFANFTGGNGTFTSNGTFSTGVHLWNATATDIYNNINSTETRNFTVFLQANLSLFLDGNNGTEKYEFETTVNITGIADDCFSAACEVCVGTDHPGFNNNNTCGINRTSLIFNITVLRTENFTEGTTVTLTVNRSVNISSDSRTDMEAVQFNISTGGTTSNVQFMFPGGGVTTLFGSIEGLFLILREFISDNNIVDAVNLSYLTAGSQIIQVNASPNPVLLRFDISGFDIDADNEFSFNETFDRNSAGINGTLTTGHAPVGIYDDFIHNKTGRWESLTPGLGDFAYLTNSKGEHLFFDDDANGGTSMMSHDTSGESLVDFRNLTYVNIDFVTVDQINTCLTSPAVCGTTTVTLTLFITDGTSKVQCYKLTQSDAGTLGSTRTNNRATNFSFVNQGGEVWQILHNVSISAGETPSGSTCSLVSLDETKTHRMQFESSFTRTGTKAGAAQWFLHQVNTGAAWAKRNETNGTYSLSNTVTSKPVQVTATDVSRATLSAKQFTPSGTLVEYSMSRDCDTFEVVQPDLLHVFTGPTGNTLCWQAVLNGTNETSPEVFFVGIDVVKAAASDIEIDIQNDGDVEFTFSGELNDTNSPITVNFTDLTEGINNIKISSGTGGQIQVDNFVLNHTVNPVVLNFTNFEDCELCQINVTFLGGPLTIEFLEFDFLGSKNYSAFLFSADGTGNVEQTSLIQVFFSKFNVSLGIENYEFYDVFPSSITQQNITPFLQKDNGPILNISSQAYDEPFDVYVRVNGTLNSCLTIDFSNSTSRNESSGIHSFNLRSDFESICNDTQPLSFDQCYIWNFIDLGNCSNRFEIPLFEFGTICSDCVFQKKFINFTRLLTG